MADAPADRLAPLKTKVNRNGRIVLPAAFRKAVGLKPGDDVIMFVQFGGIRVAPVNGRAARARAILESSTTGLLGGPSMADELIAERRAEAAREEAEAQAWKARMTKRSRSRKAA